MAGIAPVTVRDRLTPVLHGLSHKPGEMLRDNRLLILAELLMVILVRFQVLLPFSPATIPLPLLGSLSLWLRQSGWREIGLGRPASWGRTILAGVGIAVAWTALDWWVTLPLVKRITGQPLDVSEYASLPGNLYLLLVWVALSWTLAAFGEEMVYRGYLLNRLADLLGRHRAGWALSLLVMGLLFGWGHNYQGTTGLLLSIYDGIVMGVLYLASGRNLWLTVIEHGAGNTLGFILVYLGYHP
jgi:membrane protease YdiL (CAAX protease family)